MDLLDWVLWVHIVTGALWIGGVMWQEGHTAGARREGEERYVRAVLRAQATNGKLYPAVTLIVFGTAIWLIVGRDYLDFGILWINIAFALFIISFATGIAYFSRTERRLSAELASGGFTAEIAAKVRTMHTVARVETILLLVLVWLMVFKPA